TTLFRSRREDPAAPVLPLGLRHLRQARGTRPQGGADRAAVRGRRRPGRGVPVPLSRCCSPKAMTASPGPTPRAAPAWMDAIDPQAGAPTALRGHVRGRHARAKPSGHALAGRWHPATTPPEKAMKRTAHWKMTPAELAAATRQFDE